MTIDNKPDEQWNELLEWLQNQSTEIDAFKAKVVSSIDRGRSLVAIEDIRASTPILSLPQSVLLTTKSIPEEFKNSYRPNLTSTQALSLFIAHFRSTQRTLDDNDNDHQSFLHPCNPFRSYLLTLPDNFLEIPLTWVLKATFGDMNLIHASHLPSLERLEDSINSYYPSQSFNPDGPLKHYRLMSPTTIKNCHDVLRRFYLDWSLLVEDLTRVSPQVLLSELVWAWLVVNTRCVWYNLGSKNHADNIALAPAFDMANHSPTSTVTPVMTPHTLTMYSSHPRGIFSSPRSRQVLSSSKASADSDSSEDRVCIKQGEEITFSYGPHGNSTLLAEYGFIINTPDPNPWDSIDITDQVEALFHISSSEAQQQEEAQRKISILKQSNYWSDYTIQCHPIEFSHRNLVALRLLHLPLDRVDEWYDHVEGKLEQLDGEVERAVQASLEAILADCRREAQRLLDFIISHADEDHHHRFGLSVYSFECLKTLASNEFNLFSKLTTSLK